MNRHERRAAARKSQAALRASGATTPAALSASGRAHLQAGRVNDAQACCQRALAIEPDHPDSLHLAGLLALNAGEDMQAVDWLTRAIGHTPTAEYLSSLAIALHRQGRIEDASKAFDTALQLRPDGLQGWKNLAGILFAYQRMDGALFAYRQVLDLDPRDWEAACRTGYLHYRLGQLEEALSYFGVCDSVRPNDAPTIYMRAAMLRGLGRFEQAIAEGMRAHALDPGDADTCSDIGQALQGLHRHAEALPWFDRALGLQPDLEQALYHKAVSLAKLRRAGEASAIHDLLKRTRRHDSTVTELDLARLLINLSRYEEALAALDDCDRRQPNHAFTLQLRAQCLHGLKQLQRSLAEGRRAHALDPNNAEICNTIGAVLHGLGRYDEALAWLEMAIERRPSYVDALNNKASALAQLHRLTEAATTYEQVRSIDADNAVAALGAAHLRLLNGDFEAGWAGREARWRVPDLPIVYPNFSQPMWLGQSNVAGKTILIYADEGIGDAIQFARYLPMVAALGARVVLVVPETLRRLLSNVAGVSLCLANNSTEAMPPFDVYCPMLSLPLAFGTRLDTIPAATPYLPRPAADRISAWNGRLGAHDRLRVGLAWSGNPIHSNDLNRSIPLSLLARITDVDAAFISLQKDPKADDKSILEKLPIVDLTAGLDDFGETAALMCCLDLVISVDTAVAHLAGGLALPTWLLLPRPPDYRWLLDRDDSPWYPTVRLFRQDETRDYASVLERLRSELIALSSAHRAAKSE